MPLSKLMRNCFPYFGTNAPQMDMSIEDLITKINTFLKRHPEISREIMLCYNAALFVAEIDKKISDSQKKFCKDSLSENYSQEYNRIMGIRDSDISFILTLDQIRHSCFINFRKKDTFLCHTAYIKVWKERLCYFHTNCSPIDLSIISNSNHPLNTIKNSAISYYYLDITVINAINIYMAAESVSFVLSPVDQLNF
jgi:hypothetical protein